MKKIITTLLLFFIFIPITNATVINYKDNVTLTNNIDTIVGTTTGYITTTNTDTNTIVTSYDFNNKITSQKQLNILNNITTITNNNTNIIAGIKPNSYITIYYLDENLRINNTLETTIKTNNITNIKLYTNNNKLYLLLTTNDYLLIDNYLYEIDENYNINKNLFASYSQEELLSILKSDYYAIKNTYQTINNETYYYTKSTYNRNYQVLVGTKEDISFNKQHIISTININNEIKTFTINNEILDIEIINDKLIILVPNKILIYSFNGNDEEEITTTGTKLSTISNNLIVYTNNNINFYEYDCLINVSNEPYGTVNVTENIKPYDKVDIEVITNSGYKLESIKVMDLNGNEIEITDNQFTMPDNSVYVIPTYTASVVNPETADKVFILVGIILLVTFIWKKVYKKYLWLK